MPTSRMSWSTGLPYSVVRLSRALLPSLTRAADDVVLLDCLQNRLRGALRYADRVRDLPESGTRVVRDVDQDQRVIRKKSPGHFCPLNPENFFGTLLSGA